MTMWCSNPGCDWSFWDNPTMALPQSCPKCGSTSFSSPKVGLVVEQQRDDLVKRVADLKQSGIKQAREIEQILGKALGYTWFKDDQKNFPGATEVDGVCVGDHVPESIAAETARRIADLEHAADALQLAAEKAYYLLDEDWHDSTRKIVKNALADYERVRGRK